MALFTVPLMLLCKMFNLVFGAILTPARFIIGLIANSGFLKIEVLLIWTFLAAFYREQIANSGLLITNTILFSIAWCCIIFAESTVRKIRSRYLLKKIFVREILGALLISSFPVHALFYIWFPLYSQLPCVVHQVVGKYTEISDEYRAAFAIVVAAMVFILGLIYQPTKLFPEEKPKRACRKYLAPAVGHIPVTRSMTQRYRLGRCSPTRNRSYSAVNDWRSSLSSDTCSSSRSSSHESSCS